VHHKMRTATEPKMMERSTKPSLNPYYVDDVAMTLTDIMRARGADRGSVASR
jgi:hypothetical protein